MFTSLVLVAPVATADAEDAAASVERIAHGVGRLAEATSTYGQQLGDVPTHWRLAFLDEWSPNIAPSVVANVAAEAKDGGKTNVVFALPLAWEAKGWKQDPAASLAALEAVARGDRDALYAGVAQSLVDAGFPGAVLRLGHEHNMAWAPWHSGGGQAEAFVAAWRRAADRIREVAPGIVLDWNVGNAPRVGDTYWDPASWPGDEYVDVVGRDVYCRSEGKVASDVEQSLEILADWAAAHGKPISIPEVGITLPIDGVVPPDSAGTDELCSRVIVAVLGFAERADLAYLFWWAAPKTSQGYRYRPTEEDVHSWPALMQFFREPQPPIELSVADVTVVEVDNASDATAVVTFDRPAPVAGSFQWRTADGSAITPPDYGHVPLTTVIFDAGTTSVSLPLRVSGDSVFEPEKSFRVLLRARVGTAIADGSAVVTIEDDDAPPEVTPTDVAVEEGNAATKTVQVVLAFDRPAPQAGSFTWRTRDGTAVAPADYVAKAPTKLFFTAGATSKTVAVTIKGDRVFEPEETIDIVIDDLVGATSVDPEGTITVADDDGPPVLAPSDVSVVEGDALTKTVDVVVSFDRPAPQAGSFTWRTADGTATAPSDFTAKAPTLVAFAAGTTSKTVTATIRGDRVLEPQEKFGIVLGDLVGATSTDPSGAVTVVDDDQPAELTVRPLSVVEGDALTKTVNVVVAFDRPAPRAGSFSWRTVDGTATTAAGDYVGKAPTVVRFTAGTTSKTLPVTIKGDRRLEPEEAFSVVLGNVVDATAPDPSGTVTITDDDPSPVLSLADVSVVEGNALTKTVTVVVVFDRPAKRAGSFTWRTVDGSAVAPGDYVAKAPTKVSFAAGTKSKQLTVTIKGDRVAEADELFDVVIGDLVDALAPDPVAKVTVVDDD